MIFSRKKIFLEFLNLKSQNLFKLNNSKQINFFVLNKKIYNLNIIDFFIDFYKAHSFKPNLSILDLCFNLNETIPHYCYHPSLSIAGNCRMCLVEVSSIKKPIASCATDVINNQQILTNTFLVNKAREGITEFLLVNHPLDCPICDQAGSCDLQDITYVYGSDRGRFYHKRDFKRSLHDFLHNPLIKVILTRCIHCTRCVRFLSELEGNSYLGMLGRGKTSEIGLYSKYLYNSVSELTSNVIDICPVGALTSKLYAFNFRPWEDFYIESIDLNDSLCTSIRVYSDLTFIKRILPIYDFELKTTWINDKTRYLTDVIQIQQLWYPSIRRHFFRKKMKDYKKKTILWFMNKLFPNRKTRKKEEEMENKKKRKEKKKIY